MNAMTSISRPLTMADYARAENERMSNPHLTWAWIGPDVDKPAPKPKPRKKLSPAQQVIEFVRAHPGTTVPEFCDATGTCYNTARLRFVRARKNGDIIQTGKIVSKGSAKTYRVSEHDA